MTKYKNQRFQRAYDVMLEMAADPKSNLYYKGKPRRGASHRCAFWDGYEGTRTTAVISGTLSAVCFAAGKAFAKAKVKP
jgi:hypothetical protein